MLRARYIKSSSFVLLLVGVFLGSQGISLANSIGIMPAYSDLNNSRSQSIFIFSLKPGESGENGLKIINDSDEERTVDVGVVDSIAASDGSFSCRQNSEKKTKVSRWIALEDDQVTVPPNENVIVDFEVTVPKGTGPGEHGACITAQDVESKNDNATQDGGGVQLGIRYAVRLAVTVPGKIVKKLNVVRTETKRLNADTYTVATYAKNTGNVSLDVKYRAQLISLFGSESKIKDTLQYPIMPGSTYGLPYEFDRSFWGGWYKARTSLAYNANTADGIGVGSNDQQRVRSETGYFFMIPAPKAIAVYLAVLLIPVGLVLRFIARKRHRKTLQKNWLPYVVQPGDTLAALAASRGIKWKKIARINGIKAPYTIASGQAMLLPKQNQSSDWDPVLQDNEVTQPVVPVVHEISHPKPQVQSSPTITAQDVPSTPLHAAPAVSVGVNDADSISTGADFNARQRTLPKVQAISSPVVGSETIPPGPVEPAVPLVIRPDRPKPRRRATKTYNWAAPSSEWSPQSKFIEPVATAKRSTRKKKTNTSTKRMQAKGKNSRKGS